MKEALMDTSRFKRRLLELERDLAARTARETRLGREQSDQGVADIGDAGVAEASASADFTEAELDSTLLVQVRDALRRIDAGTFGRCIVDGEPIEAKRLEASPWAPYCLKHQKLLEAAARHQFPTL
jgi:DnaK suppressor protein